ncbi:hypothetical protein V494_07793 [Pseudogymnoascus sp. VKM F-4513 (FW-928)]|nr:hypothetical protein V494_07793 [Pseudogymnoascus sp. VKM F-4513 (FW-928)]
MSTPMRNVEIDRHGDLCEGCHNIDLDALLEEDADDRTFTQPVLYRHLAPISVKANYSCPLCQFFLSMLKDEERTGIDAVYLFTQSRPLPVTEKTVGNHGRGSQRCLFVLTSPEWYESERPHVNYSKLPDMPVLIDPEKVDYEPLRSWCKKIKALKNSQWDDVEVQLKGADDEALPVNVIDCHSREVVPVKAPCEYFTLSYVWGAAAAAPDSPSGSSLPSHLPTTVEDAITVVKKLGYRYLWVDRYCLDRSNKAEFQTQLNQMSDIYRNGVAGIIGAAGGDADYGLPGVSIRPRTRQPRVKIGNYVLWSNMTDPRTVVKRSKWMTRAWTYQEGVFTANWLAFTDEQVFFQRSNRGMDIHERWWKVSCEMFPNGGLGADANCPLLRMFDNIWNNVGYVHWQLEPYTTRAITYQSDAVDGMLGLVKRCGKGPYPMNHYFGVPILGPLVSHRLTMARDTGRSWTLTEAFMVSLCWTSKNTGLRRLEFPSWSWAGWKTIYARPIHGILHLGLTFKSDSDFNISVETRQGLVDWEVMCYGKSWDLHEDTSLLPRELHIEAPTVQLRICQDPRTSAGDWASATTGHAASREPMGWCAMISDTECDVLIKVNLVDAETITKITTSGSITLKGVILRQMKTEESEGAVYYQNETRLFALLVLETGKETVRVGSLELRTDNYFVRWKTDVQNHKVEDSQKWVATKQLSYAHCQECRQRAFQGIATSQKQEVTRVQ